MSSFAKRHNKGGVTFEIDINNFTFKKLEELYYQYGPDEVYKMDGCFISSKGKFGDSPVAILCDKKVCANFPKHMVEEIKAILASEIDIEDIKAGNAKFMIEQYKDKNFGKTCYGVNWLD